MTSTAVSTAYMTDGPLPRGDRVDHLSPVAIAETIVRALAYRKCDLVEGANSLTPLTDSSDLLDNPDRLREQMDEEGYLFLPSLLPAVKVTSLRADFVATLVSVGWIVEGSEPMLAIASPRAQRGTPGASPAFFDGYIALQRLQAFHELAHHESILKVAGALIHDEVLVHPRKIARVALPEDPLSATPPHQDYRLIQGTGDVLTAWMPLGDCPDELGGLAVLSGSHRRGLLPVQPAPGIGGVHVDIPADFDIPDLDWRSSEMSAGDVLFFHSLTVHAAKPNRTKSLRLSVDYRYQSVDEPIVPAALRPHGSPTVPGFDDLTESWSDSASVRVPASLRLAEPFDALDPSVSTPSSRILSLVGN